MFFLRYIGRNMDRMALWEIVKRLRPLLCCGQTRSQFGTFILPILYENLTSSWQFPDQITSTWHYDSKGWKGNQVPAPNPCYSPHNMIHKKQYNLWVRPSFPIASYCLKGFVAGSHCCRWGVCSLALSWNVCTLHVLQAKFARHAAVIPDSWKPKENWKVATDPQCFPEFVALKLALPYTTTEKHT